MKRSTLQRSTFTFLNAMGSTWRVPDGGNGKQPANYREKSLVLETALKEYRRLRENGEVVRSEEFCNQFPGYRKSLLRLIDVEENLGDLGEIDDPFPVPGGQFLGFEIIDELGVGAIARVYLATEPELGGRSVVIKVSADGTAEAATLGKLQHPNIVQVYSVKKDDATGMTAVCMPYQGSATLTDVLDLALLDGRIPESAVFILDVASRLANMEALRHDDLATQRPDPVLQQSSYVDGVVHLGIQLAEALQYAHTSGVLHRDLKPSNVLLTPHGHPMLLDFNLSFDADREAMPRGGTLPYMAPEQIRAGLRRQESGQEPTAIQLDPRGDVFSLGVILYELLTLKLPYGGPPDNLGPEAASLWQLNAHEKPPQSLRDLNREVPQPVAEVIERCLASDPNRRYSTLTEVATALQLHFSRRQRAIRWVKRHKYLCRAIAGVCLLAVIATAAFFALRPSFSERQYAAGVAALNRGDYETAAKFATSAIENHKRFYTQGYLLRAEALSNTIEKKHALEDYAKAAKMAPSAALYDHWACTSYLVGRPVDAANQLKEAIRLMPNDAQLHFKYAYMASRSGAPQELVLNAVTTSIQLDPNFAPAYLLRAQCHSRAVDKIGELTADCQKAVTLQPNSIAVRLAVADSLLKARESKPELTALIQSQIQSVVSLGISKAALQTTLQYRYFRNEEWMKKLVEESQNGSQDRGNQFSDVTVPSLSLSL